MVASTLLLPLSVAQKILKDGLPFCVDLLEEIEISGGRLHLKPVLASMLDAEYPLIYEYPNATIPIAELIGQELPINQIEQIPELNMICEVFLQHLQAEFSLLDSTVDRMVASEGKPQNEAEEDASDVLSYSIAQFYEYLSVGVHGERLSSLVAQAKAGDDLAFGKAIQIDGRIAEVIPYFRERLARARVSGDVEFLGMVGNKTSNPPYKGDIGRKPVWITLAFLDYLGWLARMKAREVLDFCQSVGIGEDIVDVKNMQRIIKRFRDFQKRGSLSTP